MYGLNIFRVIMQILLLQRSIPAVNMNLDNLCSIYRNSHFAWTVFSHSVVVDNQQINRSSTVYEC